MDSDRLTDREMFSARPWRAPDRAQVIFAVVERPDAEAGGAAWFLVLATLSGSRVHSTRLDGHRTPASFTDAELQAFYELAYARAPQA